MLLTSDSVYLRQVMNFLNAPHTWHCDFMEYATKPTHFKLLH